MYNIEATRGFEQDLKKLDRAVASFVLEKIEWLAENPEAARFPLEHLPNDLRGLHKYRVGDWRVLFWIDHHKHIITLYRVRHRKDIYKHLV